MKRIGLFFVLSALTIFEATAQDKAHLRLIGAAIGDSIVLRWAVSNPDGWMKANVAGYLLERTTLNAQNQVVGKSFERMGPDTIHPWPYSSLETRLNRKDTFALIAAQCLYGKTMRTASTEGDFIKALQQADEEATNRHGYAAMTADFSAQAADILGWRWVDKTAKKGQKYIYTIRCPMLNGRIWSDTAMFVINPKDYLPLGPMDPPTLVSGEKLVIVSWKRPSHLSAFYIERSSDGQHFERLNQTPFMDWTAPSKARADSLVWIDSLGTNYKSYYYRLVGINPFAQHTPPSPAATGFGADRTAPLSALIEKAENVKEGNVRIQWAMPPETEPIKGIIIARTVDPTLPFSALNQTLLPAISTEFLDENAKQFGTNYYAVGIVDTAGNIGWSPLFYAVMTDFAPPVQPKGLFGSIDTSGNVQLRWNLGPDFDLKGYQVYVANQADHDFVPLADSLITDTLFQYKIDLQNLTESIFYRVQAFDNNLKSSELSTMLEIKKPDIIPPEAPVFDDYKVSENAVFLHWRPSNSKDAVSQMLLRRTNGRNWETLAQFPNSIASYTDSIIVAGESWEYAIQSVDDSGLRSTISFPVGVKIPALTRKKSISALTAIWDNEKRGILLQWSLNLSCDHILVYRAYGEDGLELFARLAGDSRTFFDTPKRKGKYSFALQPLYANGSKGLLSDIVTITIN